MLPLIKEGANLKLIGIHFAQTSESENMHKIKTSSIP